MSRQQHMIKKMFSQAGVAINGDNPWDIAVHDDRFYARVLRDKNLGLGEAYMDGWWNCRQLDEFVCRILRNRLDVTVKDVLRYRFYSILANLSSRQTPSRAHIIAHRHYDLDNDLFLSFLDPYNQYSCAYFRNTADLDRAQQNKLDLICKKTALCQNDHVLDIGCGWGGFAKYASEYFGCTVTAVSISQEQIRYAIDFCRGFPVRAIHCDYREIQGMFDKIVSVGMFEHVGRKNYRAFMKLIHRHLKDHGIFLLHTIGRNESGRDCDPWIAKYIFPNSMLPSMAQIAASVEGLFVVEDWHNMGPHYDKTLMAWNRNFQDAWPRLRERYDERFKRMWEYYLLSCAGAFRARSLQVWQTVLTKCGAKQPECRF